MSSVDADGRPRTDRPPPELWQRLDTDQRRAIDDMRARRESGSDVVSDPKVREAIRRGLTSDDPEERARWAREPLHLHSGSLSDSDFARLAALQRQLSPHDGQPREGLGHPLGTLDDNATVAAALAPARLTPARLIAPLARAARQVLGRLGRSKDDGEPTALERAVPHELPGGSDQPAERKPDDALRTESREPDGRSVPPGKNRIEVKEVAHGIAAGHAFQKHVLDRKEFAGINSPSDFAAHIEHVMTNPTAVKSLRDGRTAYWHDPTKTVVIRNPGTDGGGTAFRPTAGRAYFDYSLR